MKIRQGFKKYFSNGIGRMSKYSYKLNKDGLLTIRFNFNRGYAESCRGRGSMICQTIYGYRFKIVKPNKVIALEREIMKEIRNDKKNK